MKPLALGVLSFTVLAIQRAAEEMMATGVMAVSEVRALRVQKKAPHCSPASHQQID